MSEESQAGLASVVVLLHGLLWWGGALGCALLVVTSARSARRKRAGVVLDPAPAGPHELRVQQLRRDLTRISRGEPPLMTQRAREVADHPPGPPGDRDAGLLVLIAGCSAAAAGVHLAMAPVHLAEGWVHVAFFVVIGLAQAAAAVRLLQRPSRSLLLGVLLLHLAVALVWLASRSVGVLGVIEPVGSWDLAATVWELTCVAAALRLLRGAVPLRPPGTDPGTWPPLVLGGLALTGLALVLLPLGGH